MKHLDVSFVCKATSQDSSSLESDTLVIRTIHIFHVSHVMCHIFYYIFYYFLFSGTLVKLVCGGFVINGAILSSLYKERLDLKRIHLTTSLSVLSPWILTGLELEFLV